MIKAIKPRHLMVTAVILFVLNAVLVSLRMNHVLHPMWGIVYLGVCLLFWIVLIIKITRFEKRIQLREN